MTAIRDAATVICVRDPAGAREVLMGRRGREAVFMPNLYVFPGGAVDAGDAAVPLAAPLSEPCRGRLGPAADRVAAAAIRELAEETGLLLGRPGTWDAPPADWEPFARAGLRPDASALRFVFRAVTPPGRPRRFDARFFLLNAALTHGRADFAEASDELSDLRWIPLAEARRFDLPFITEIVLAEVAARLPSFDPPPDVPFFLNDAAGSRFERIP